MKKNTLRGLITKYTLLPRKTYINLAIGKEVLSVDPSYFRPTEVDLLIRDLTKAKEKLGWIAAHDLVSLVKDMMQSDVKLMQKEQYLKAGGYHSSKNLE
jgi:GDPmannose 4,6-dehydratase